MLVSFARAKTIPSLPLSHLADRGVSLGSFRTGQTRVSPASSTLRTAHKVDFQLSFF